MLVCGVTYLIVLWETITEKGHLNEILDFVLFFAVAVLSASLSFFWLTRDDDLEGLEE